MAEGTSIGSLVYDLVIDDKNLKSQLDSADNKVGDFSDKLKSGFVKAAAGFAVIGAGLTAVAKNATDYTVELVKSSKALGQQIGVSTEDASRLVAAFGRMGISADNASQMFGIFSKNIVKSTEAAKDQASSAADVKIQIEKTQKAIADTSAEIQKNGDKTGDLTIKLKELNQNLSNQKASLDKSTDAFGKLGIKTTDAQGHQKDFNTLLFEVADKFKAMPDGIDKTSTSMELFGRQGKDMIKVLDLGSQGIQELEKKADELGITLTTKNIKAVSDYIKSQKDLKDSQDAMKMAIGTTTAPVLTEFNKSISDIITSLLGTDGPLKTATIDVLAFGGPIAGFTSSLFGFASAVVQVGEAIGFSLLGSLGLALVAFILLGIAIYEMVKHSEELGNIFVVVTDRIQMAAHDVWDWISKNWPLLLDILTNPFAALGDFVGGHLGQIKNFIFAFFKDAGGWLKQYGVDLIEGFLTGGASLLPRIGEFFLSKLPGWIKTPFKKALGIASPSKVFAEMGRNVTAGFVKGVTDTKQMAVGAMDSLSNAVISPSMNFAPAVGGSGAAAGPTTNFGDTVVNIGQINNAQDESYVLRRLDRNQELEGRGGSPVTT